MKNIFRFIVFAGLGCSFFLIGPRPATAAETVEPWKGQSDPAELHLGVLAGMGIIDSQAGFALMGTFSKKIDHHGFVPEINDSVSLETEMGPLFVSGTTVFAYSLHFRWDFQKDVDWTIFAIGGLAGDITGTSLGSRFILLPRLGVGAFYRVASQVLMRAEVSHELVAMGAAFPF